MTTKKGYRSASLDFTRKMVIASIASNKKNAIHSMSKIDISGPQKIRINRQEKTGEKPSLTAYIIRCFAETIKEYPEMNSFIKSNRLILLDDINISVMIEREIDGTKVPEPLGIKNTGEKTVKEIQDEIRNAQNDAGNKIGNLTGTTWIKYIPGFLLKTFVKLANRNIKMAKRYGKVAVTAIGMYLNSSSWFIPHGTATVLLTIGSISNELVQQENGQIESKEMLHVTASFDHEIIDGAPAARFMSRFEEILKSGDLLKE